MKKQVTDVLKIFAMHTTNNELVSKVLQRAEKVESKICLENRITTYGN